MRKATPRGGRGTGGKCKRLDPTWAKIGSRQDTYTARCETLPSPPPSTVQSKRFSYVEQSGRAIVPRHKSASAAQRKDRGPRTVANSITSRLLSDRDTSRLLSSSLPFLYFSLFTFSLHCSIPEYSREYPRVGCYFREMCVRSEATIIRFDSIRSMIKGFKKRKYDFSRVKVPLFR